MTFKKNNSDNTKHTDLVCWGGTGARTPRRPASPPASAALSWWTGRDKRGRWKDEKMRIHLFPFTIACSAAAWSTHRWQSSASLRTSWCLAWCRPNHSSSSRPSSLSGKTRRGIVSKRPRGSKVSRREERGHRPSLQPLRFLSSSTPCRSISSRRRSRSLISTRKLSVEMQGSVCTCKGKRKESSCQKNNNKTRTEKLHICCWYNKQLLLD